MAYRGATRGAGAGPRLSTGHQHQQQQRTASPASTPRGWGSPAPQQQQPQQPQHSAAATASAFPSLSGKAKPEDKMKERTLFVIVSLIGNTVVATTTAGRKYVGILHSTSTEGGQLGVTLSSAQELQSPSALGPPTRLLVIKGQDLDIVEAHDVVLGEPVSDSPANGTFRTDVEISAREAADDRFSRGRTLTAWNDDDPAASKTGSDGHLDGNTANTSTGAWDQFAANEARFGVKSNYDEDMYTTKLDRNRKNFKEEEKKAERLAAEIMGQASTNTHLAEERGQVDDSGQNEEDKYGAVVRGPGAYVPPAARRAAEAAAATTAATTANGGAPPTTASPRVVLQEASEKKAAAAAASQVPGIAVKVPTPTKNTGTGAESTSPGVANQGDSIRDFHQFVASEKARIQNQRIAAREQQKRGIITNKEQNEQVKRQTLSDLKAWSTNFKLKTPVPDDVASVGQQNSPKRAAPGTAAAALQKSLSPTTAHTQSAGVGKTAPATSSAVPSPSGGAGTAGAVPAAKSVSSSGKLAESKALLANMTIPKIPPFKAKPAPAAAPSQPSAAGLPTSTSTTFKMSAKASTFKPFNPAAPSFTPGASATAGATATAAVVSPALSNTAAPVKAGGSSFGPNAALANPFFGTRVLKMSPVPIHVREDFNPFKTGKVPESTTVTPNWPYNGKSSRAILSVAGPSGPADGQPQPLDVSGASAGGASTGLPPTPASQHQSAHGTPSSQASGMLGGVTPSSQPSHPHGQPLGASPGPLPPQHVIPGGGPPMGHMAAGGPHPVQQGQAPFGMVYQAHQGPGGPGGPYRFPPQQPMQGQYMVHGVPGMGMPVGVGGPPMQYGGPGHVPQPGMPPFMGAGGHGAHMGPHGHALGPGQHQMHHPQHMNQHQQQQQHTGNGPHPGPLHPPPPVGMMHYGSPPIPPQQQHSAGPMMSAAVPQAVPPHSAGGPPPPPQQQQQPPFSAAASPQIGGNNVRPGGGPPSTPSGGNPNGNKQGGAGGGRSNSNAAKNASSSGRPMGNAQYAASGSPAPVGNSHKGKGGA